MFILLETYTDVCGDFTYNTLCLLSGTCDSKHHSVTLMQLHAQDLGSSDSTDII